jgi:UDP-glucose 4-epimerase
MNWHGKRVLVTGGAGFLGSNLCHTLAARGAKVAALDGFLFGGGANPANLSDSPAGTGDGQVELVRADIRDIDLRPICEGRDVIFNLAAQTSHMGGQRDPLADIAVNAVAQVRLIGAVREAAPNAVVVHASTRQFYGCRSMRCIRWRRPTPTACQSSPVSNTGCWNIACRAGRSPRCG